MIPPGGTTPAPGGDRRARLLLRWYPRNWRARYGEEFTELLIAEFAERPRSWRRAADVARGGLLARLAQAGLASGALTAAGLAGDQQDPAAGQRASLATLACSVAVFLTAGAAMWGQLAVGWEWAPPASPGAATAMAVMSAALLLFAVLAVLSAAPAVVAVARATVAGQASALRRPILLMAVGALVLILGSRHFGTGWPGRAAHWWPHQGLLPGGVAAFSWACTLSVTSYWAHPAALATFPPAELAWMAVSPAALLGLVTGAAQLVRRVKFSPRVLRHEAWVGSAALAAMVIFAGGALCWVIERGPEPQGPGPQGLFRAGHIDVAGLAVMVIALAVGWRALQQARGPGQPIAPHPPAAGPAGAGPAGAGPAGRR